jgi:hypothetical protein
MAKKVDCTVLKSDPFVERRQNPREDKNQCRRDDDSGQISNNPYYCVGWLGFDRVNFELFLSGLAIDYYA